MLSRLSFTRFYWIANRNAPREDGSLHWRLVSHALFGRAVIFVFVAWFYKVWCHRYVPWKLVFPSNVKQNFWWRRLISNSVAEWVTDSAVLAVSYTTARLLFVQQVMLTSPQFLSYGAPRHLDSPGIVRLWLLFAPLRLHADVSPDYFCYQGDAGCSRLERRRSLISWRGCLLCKHAAGICPVGRVRRPLTFFVPAQQRHRAVAGFAGLKWTNE